MNHGIFFETERVFREEIVYEWQVRKQIFYKDSSRSFTYCGRNGVSRLGDVRDRVCNYKRLFF